MAITTNVPSNNFEDLQRDVQDATRFTNAAAPFTNRVGLSITPIPVRDSQLAAKVAEAASAVEALGWFPVAGSFTDGGTITARNQILFNDADESFYSWSGALPKVVPAASTPASTGGISANAWINRGDAALRSALAAPDSTVSVGGVEAGVIAKGTERSVWEFVSLVIDKPSSDPSTWDWTPAAQALANAKPEIAMFPPIAGDGVYRTSAPIVFDSHTFIKGFKAKRLGSAAGTRIENVGSGDTIVYSDTKPIYDAGISNIGITSTTGHAINIKFGAVRCKFSQLYLYTKATDKSCVWGDYSFGTPGVDYIGAYSCIFEGGEYIVDKVTRTAGIIEFKANQTLVNENEIRNIWITNSKGVHAVRLLCTVSGVYLTNNKLDCVTFEVCPGGLVELQATSHTTLANISGWDNPDGYDNSLIKVSDNSAVFQNRNLVIENFARIGASDALNGSAVDIDLGFSLNNVIISHARAGADGKIDCKNRSTVIIGAPNATVTNDAATTIIQGAGATATQFATRAGNRLRDLSGNADIQAPAGSAGFTATFGSDSRRVYLDANPFFGGGGAWLPAVDNQINLGHSSNRYKQAFVVTASISGALVHTGTSAGFYGKTAVAQPTALPNTSGATLGELETQVNSIKQKLRDLGLMAT